MKPIGILGGTFDPVHHGHLRLALEVLEAADLDSVRLIPLYKPPHREPPVAPASLRQAMLEAAVEGETSLLVDDRELQRKGVSYTVDTLISLRQEFTDHPICLILGLDAFRTLPTWYRWEKLLDLAHIVVCHRPGIQLAADEPGAHLAKSHAADSTTYLHALRAGRVLRQATPVLDISATRIRGSIATGHSVRYLLPEGVLALIRKHRLYDAL
jgi:nicotinate-nucleotide adenylyltransferase